MYEVIASYFAGRKQRVKLGGHASEWLTISNGVPQGSMFGKYLALLDYVSRAHEIELRPSYVVRRPSVRRPSVASIISEVTAWIAFKFQLWLPLGLMPRCSFHF